MWTSSIVTVILGTGVREGVTVGGGIAITRIWVAASVTVGEEVGLRVGSGVSVRVDVFVGVIVGRRVRVGVGSGW